MNKKFFAFVMTFALAASAAFGADAFKIGGTGPLTGGAAIYGNAVKNGAQIAADEINAAGAIKVEVKYEDDTHDAEKAVNAYNALKDWGMQISMGSVTSKPCEATAAESFSDRIFALTPSASSPAAVSGKSPARTTARSGCGRRRSTASAEAASCAAASPSGAASVRSKPEKVSKR